MFLSNTYADFPSLLDEFHGIIRLPMQRKKNSEKNSQNENQIKYVQIY